MGDSRSSTTYDFWIIMPYDKNHKKKTTKKAKPVKVATGGRGKQRKRKKA